MRKQRFLKRRVSCAGQPVERHAIQRVLGERQREGRKSEIRFRELNELMDEIYTQHKRLATISLNVLVHDDDPLRLLLTLSANQLVEGQTVLATVTRNLVTTNPVTVFLNSSRPHRLNGPPTVTIPAGQASASVLLAAVANDLIEAEANVTVTASAPLFANSTASVTVADDDHPTLQLVIEPAGFSEAAGPFAALGSVLRSPVTAKAVIVQLRSSDPEEAIVPANVTIPANAAGVSFPIGAVDDAEQDGPQTVTLSAFIGESFPLGPITSQTVQVTDDDGPALKLVLAKSVVREGLTPATLATITRQPVTAMALTVQLTSSDTSEATLPGSVDIPANTAAVTVPIASVDDGVPDGKQSVLISATAAGHAGDSRLLVVSDQSLPDLVITELSAPASGAAGETATLSYRLANYGLATFHGIARQRLVLSTDAVLVGGDDVTVGDHVFEGVLAEGGVSEVQTVPLPLPLRPGDYQLFVYADAAEQVAEVLEDNNASAAAGWVRVSAGYSATAQTDILNAPAGTEIPIYGAATTVGGAPASNVVVKLRIDLRDTRREVELLTDDQGHFSYRFLPLPNEAGYYELRALHPGVEDAPVQDAFTLYGMRFDPGELAVTVPALEARTNELRLVNASDLPLTGLSVAVENTPASAQIEVTAPASLAGAASAVVRIVTRSLADVSGGGVATVRLTSAEGATALLPVTVALLEKVARLTVLPHPLEAGMVRGQQTLFAFDITNVGGEETGPITVGLPEADWLQLASASPLASLPPGATARVTLRLTPSAELPLGAYAGHLALAAASTSLAVPFSFNCISTAVGDVAVTVVDEFTFYGDGAPKVAGANVALRQPDTGTVVAQGVTDANGLFFTNGVPEATYLLEVLADKHLPSRKNLRVAAGVTNRVDAFISREVVRYLWTVTPVLLEDRVDITIRTEFETMVPAPVVTIDPSPIYLTNFQGEVMRVTLQITNHGLIAAQDMKLRLPTIAGFVFETPTTELGTLPAQSSFAVPMVIRKLSQGARGERDGGGGAGCGGAASVLWSLLCAGAKNSYSASTPVLNPTSCNLMDPSGWIPGDPSDSSCCGPPGDWEGNPPAFSRGAPGQPTAEEPDCDCTDNFEPQTLLSYNVGEGLNAITGAIETWAKRLPFCDEVKVELDANGVLKTCCTDGGSIGIEGEASGKATIDATFIPYGASINLPRAGWGDAAGNQITADGELWGGTKVNFNGEVSGMATTGCNLEHPLATAEGHMDVKLSVGLEAKVKWSCGGPAVAGFDPEDLSGEVGGQLTLNVAGRFTGKWDSEVGGDFEACFLGAWVEGQVNVDTPLGSIQWPANPKYYFVKPTCEENPEGAPPALLLNPGDPGEMAQVEAQLRAQFDRLNLELRQAQALRQLVRSSSAPRAASAGAYGPRGGKGVCARVRLQLDHQLVMARSAFNATLEISNGSPDQALEDVNVQLGVFDAENHDGLLRFHLPPPTLTGLQGSFPAALLPPATTGRATWLMIPTEAAAANGPTVYWVGGYLNYTSEGQLVRIPLEPTRITVYPDAKLRVKYFHQRDVFSDDPFTDEIEPAEPFALGVLVHNVGLGAARSVRIASGQPQIIENEKGLLIDFKIIGTQVGTQTVSPSLAVDLGQIDPGKVAVARWSLVSSLHGQFIDYDATFEHTDALGDDHASPVESVEIHELIHLVRDPYADDGLPDFLVNDIANGGNLPDTLYLSDGQVQPVQVVLEGTHDRAPDPDSPTNQFVQITASMPAGWAYLRLPDPSGGSMRLVRVTRNDGAEIPFGENAWITDRTFIENAQRPINEFQFHLLDLDSTGCYTLEYAPIVSVPDTNAPASMVNPLAAVSPATFTVSWRAEDEPGGSGVAKFDVFVSTDGGPFLPWRTDTAVGAGVFEGEAGRRYAFYSVATDAAGNREAPPASPDAETVTTGNQAPTIAAIPDQHVLEGQTLVLAIAANDDATPMGRLKFELLNAPPGMVVDAEKGVVTWPTGEAHGPNNYQPSVVVTDDGSPRLSASRSFKVQVAEVNTAPQFQPAASTFTVKEGQLLRIDFDATDADLPAQSLHFSLEAGAPPGAAISPLLGLFTWTPSETQGGQTYVLTAHVSDNTTPALSATHRFTVTVLEDNSPPVIGPVADQLVFESFTLELPIMVSDPDVPIQHLTCALGAGAPEGMAWPSTRGVLTWTPTEAQLDTTNRITLLVSDDGVPTATSSRTFTVVARRLKEGLNLPRRAAGGGWAFTFKGEVGRAYRIETSEDLISWQELFSVTPSNRIITVTDPDPVLRNYRYYRAVPQ